MCMLKIAKTMEQNFEYNMSKFVLYKLKMSSFKGQNHKI